MNQHTRAKLSIQLRELREQPAYDDLAAHIALDMGEYWVSNKGLTNKHPRRIYPLDETIVRLKRLAMEHEHPTVVIKAIEVLES